MDNDNEQRKTARNLLHALDDTIEKGPWDKSVFLGAIGKKLKEIRFNFKNRIRFLDPGFEEFEEAVPQVQSTVVTSISATPSAIAIPQPTDNQIEAFVSLYNVEGGNIQKWEKILSALEKQIVTRPVYATEQEMRALMRTKINRRNDAYASFLLDKTDVIPPKDGKAPLDRLGNKLLMLKDTALKLGNITRFYHESGIYSFQNNTLIRVGDVDAHYFD